MTLRFLWFLPLLLAACGGSSDTAPAVSGDVRLTAARSGDVTAYVQARLRQRPSTGGLPGDVLAPAAGSGAPPSVSRTQLLEAGVDETDLLRTDGTHLYTLYPQNPAGPQLAVHRRAADGSTSQLASLQLSADPALSIDTDGMMLSDDARTLAVLTQQWVAAPSVCPGGVACAAVVLATPSTALQRVDVSNPAQPVPGQRLVFDGALVDSRRTGNTLLLVTRHRPVFAVEQLPSSALPSQRNALIDATTAADALPRVRVNGGAPQPLVSETDCWLQAGNGATTIEFVTITLLDLASPTLAMRSRCFAGGAEAISMTTDMLYVATTRWSPPPVDFAPWPADTKTDLHQFALTGGSVAYRASGTVEGHLGWEAARKPLRLSPYGGDLRVISYTGTTGVRTASAVASTSPPPASPATLTVLRERNGTLEVLSTLPNARRPAPIGKPGEQIYGVRFIGTRGYVTTFQRTDPLYVLDLSDPADPRVVGELQMNGVADHLLPLSDRLVFGVGREADANGTVTGLKMMLVDVADPAAPRLVDSRTMGGAWSKSALDLSRQALSWRQDGSIARIALPVLLSVPLAPEQTRGLARFEVDTAAVTLAERPMLGARTVPTWDPDWWADRSVLIDDRVYHLSSGVLTPYVW